ncbi:hypothetical protein P7K49_020041 [Saguinus oedipus]|uniref:Uncharacterized protein n=1 Tax=Saguinus oedipus TaxID=9490 RepID=A0ABQ9UZ30_SAGOE|nr:hypothetical protein P7K49_020041 [Saguinus oedipus]
MDSSRELCQNKSHLNWTCTCSIPTSAAYRDSVLSQRFQHPFDLPCTPLRWYPGCQRELNPRIGCFLEHVSVVNVMFSFGGRIYAKARVSSPSMETAVSVGQSLNVFSFLGEGIKYKLGLLALR